MSALREQLALKETEAAQLREQFELMDNQINSVSDLAAKFKDTHDKNAVMAMQIEELRDRNR